MTQAGELSRCLSTLKSAPSLALDLEFDSHRNAYGVTLCLIQIATPDLSYVIDPLANLDLKGVFEVLENPQVLKIVHSPGEDLRLLHSLGCVPQNLFDTEVTAKLLNYEQTSLSALLQSRLGFGLDKGQQRSNWLKRPLSDAQITYAAADVTALHALRKILLEEAHAAGIMEYIEEEQAALSTTIYKVEPKDSFLKPGDLRHLSLYDQYVLNGLFQFRDELARKVNRPAFQIMDEELLREVAAGKIDASQVPYAHGVFGNFRNDRFGEQIASCLRRLHSEAEVKALSHARPPRQHESHARRDKAEIMAIRNEIFAPIQSAIAGRFGEFAARFILSNGTVTDVIRGSSKLSQIKRDYKRRLIQETAQSLGISIDAFW